MIRDELQKELEEQLRTPPPAAPLSLYLVPSSQPAPLTLSPRRPVDLFPSSPPSVLQSQTKHRPVPAPLPQWFLDDVEAKREQAALDAEYEEWLALAEAEEAELAERYAENPNWDLGDYYAEMAARPSEW